MSDPRLDISRLVRPLFQVETLLCRPRLGVLLRTCAVKQFAHTHTHTLEFDQLNPHETFRDVCLLGDWTFCVTTAEWNSWVGPGSLGRTDHWVLASHWLACHRLLAQTWVLRLRHKANIDVAYDQKGEEQLWNNQKHLCACPSFSPTGP